MNEESIFDRLVARPPDEWAKLLDEACEGNVDLRSRVESLLNAHRRADGLFEMPALEFVADVTNRPVVAEVGTTVGPYKLLQKIGEGGMGVVFMADQRHPVNRRVAVKIIKPGMYTREVFAQFRSRAASTRDDGPSAYRQSS